MCELGEPVAPVHAGERALQKFQKRVIEEMKKRQFDKRFLVVISFERTRERA